jgi:hypothetical protein
MKRKFGSIAAVLFSLCMVVGAQSVFAEETATVAAGKNLYFSIGVKVWAAEWQTTMQGSGNITSTSAPAEPVLIPALGIKYRDFFVSGSYFNATKFDFQKFSSIENYGPPTGFAVTTTKVTAERGESDLNAGFYIFRSVALSLGYKQISQKYHSLYTTPGLADFESDSETTIKGPTIGIVASASIGEGLGIYENFSYGQLKATYTGGSHTDDARYISSELGFTYRAGIALMSLGYKYQAIDTKVADTELVGPDVTKGFLFGVNFVF